MSDIELVKEYANRTNEKIETYFERTNEAIQTMAVSVDRMAQTVQDSSEQLARYEERQNSSAERMERLEQTIREQGIIQRNDKKDTDDKINQLRDDVKDNTAVRKAVIWLVGIIVTTMIGGGMLLGSITGKVLPNEKTNNPTPTNSD